MIRSKKGASDFEEIDSAWVKNKLGVDIKSIPDLMAITGDSSDNIPGVKGIGEKGKVTPALVEKIVEMSY